MTLSPTMQKGQHRVFETASLPRHVPSRATCWAERAYGPSGTMTPSLSRYRDEPALRPMRGERTGPMGYSHGGLGKGSAPPPAPVAQASD
jgi:hypothetical protein